MNITEIDYKKNSPFVRKSNYVYLGEYPQTIKDNCVSVANTTDMSGYYLGSDGQYYAKITATPDNDNYKFSNGEIVVNDRNYYFKVEPIKWKILIEEYGNTFLVCNNILAAMPFDKKTNNYAESSIRKWLNDVFYNVAFNDLQKELIQLTKVDNSAYSTGNEYNDYACNDTYDRVFLLSYREVSKKEDGFCHNQAQHDTEKMRLASDYSIAMGANVCTDSDNSFGKGCWWLRSAYDHYRQVYCIGVDGHGGITCASSKYVGIVPALRIDLR